MKKGLRQPQGLTLIEVMVALAIVAIALTAIIKSVSQHIRSVSHLQDKTVALWVSQNVIAKAQLGLLDLPRSDTVTNQTDMLGRTWFWSLAQAATPNPHISKLTVKVFTHENHEDASPILQLEGYRYHET